MNQATLLLLIALLSAANLCTATIVPINGKPENHLNPVSHQQCESPSDCMTGQICAGVCISLPSEVTQCSCDNPCEGSSTCTETTIASISFCLPNGFNIPEEAADLIRPIDCGVCIGVDMLNHFASHELVFKKHVLSRVLCDAAGSCATRGHIVNYKGRGMMMKRYCDIVGCTEKVMVVNSPRYQRGLKVESRSEGMHFTAFAARYETSAEEAVLAAAVRVGL